MPRRVMHYNGSEKLILHAASLKPASPSGHYILDPPAISAISERDKEPLRLSKNIYRRPVEPA